MALNGVRVLLLMVVFLLFLISIDALYKYDLLFRDEKIFSACDIPNVHFINEYLNFSNLHFESQNDGSVYIYGEAELIKDYGTQNNPLLVDVFKSTRSEWVNTIYSIRRPDICTAVFDSTEFWYMFFKDIKDKTCPPLKGQLYNMNTSSIMSLIFPDPRLEGNYKIQIKVHFNEINEIMCANVLTELYKVPFWG